MSLLALFLLIVLTCVVCWLWRIAYNHAGAIPDAPPIMKWAVQGITIIFLIAIVCTLWGIGGGYINGGDIRLR